MIEEASEKTPGGGFASSSWNNLEAPAASLFLSGSPPLPMKAAIGMNQDSRLEAFVCGADNSIYRKAQSVPGGTWGDGWYSLGAPGPALAPPVPLLVQHTGLLHLFVLGADGALYLLAQPIPNH